MESILLYSKDAAKLAWFYQKKVGLKLSYKAKMGDSQNLFAFETRGKSALYIIDNPKIKGKNSEPQRFTLNLEVREIKAGARKLVRARVKKITDIYHIEGYGYCATFEDIDGNRFQLVQVRSN